MIFFSVCFVFYLSYYGNYSIEYRLYNLIVSMRPIDYQHKISGMEFKVCHAGGVMFKLFTN